MMKTNKILVLLALIMMAITTHAQEEKPSIDMTATFIDSEGKEVTTTTFEGSAPLVGHFAANPKNVGAYSENYEWHFYMDGEEDTPYLIRYEEVTEYTFTTAGAHHIVCYATFINGTDTVRYDKAYWSDNPDHSQIKVTIYESDLKMPNAFSPNSDGENKTYHAKDGYKSIVEFHAYIFNRWGQKLYEWDDPAGEWDGTFNGKPVKEGVYYCLVKAKGADGRKFNIRTDVNLLRGYTEKGSSTSGTP